MAKPHRFQLRVYYEDTDLAGVVYYANYLKFIERARSEMVRDLGIDQKALQGEGLVFVVRRVVADYLSSARYDDELTVKTEVTSVTGARLVLQQQVVRADQTLFTADVTLVLVAEGGRIARVPANIRQKLQ